MTGRPVFFTRGKLSEPRVSGKAFAKWNGGFDFAAEMEEIVQQPLRLIDHAVQKMTRGHA
jgi:hypothetical protein